MATIHEACHQFLLLILSFQVLTSSTATIYKEDCESLGNNINFQDKAVKDIITGIDLSLDTTVNSLQCKSLVQTVQTVCDHAKKNDISSKIFYVTCEMGRQLVPFFQSIGLKYEKHELVTSCLAPNYQKASVRANLHSTIQFIKDMLVILSGNKLVLITDLKPDLLRKELMRYSLPALVITPSFAYKYLNTTKYQGVHFFVLCTPETTQNVLRAAKSQNVIYSPQSWIILTDIDKETLLQNISIPYNTHLAVATTSHKSETILPHNAVLMWTPQDPQSINCANIDIISPNSNTEVAEVDGNDVTFSMDLFEVYSVTDEEPLQFVDFGSWFSINKRLRLKYVFPNMLRKLSGVKLRVVTLNAPPYVVFKNKNNQIDPKGLEGFYGYLFNALAEEMNFTFTLSIASAYGLKNSNGIWNGQFKQLQENEADIALSDLSMTTDRKQVADFSSKISSGSLRLTYKKPDEKYYFRLYIIPFGWEIWILVTASIVVSGVLLYITNRVSPNSALRTTTDPIELVKVKHQFSMLDCLLAVYNGFNQQGSELEPREVSGKIIFITIYLSFVIIFSSYTSVFTSFLTISETKILFETLEEVLKDSSYKIGTLRDTNYQNIFKEETDANSIQYKVWKRMEEDKENLVANVKDGLNRAYEYKYIFLNTKQTSSYYLGNNCSFDISAEDIYTDSFHFAYRKNFQYAETFNEYINRLVEGGIIARLNSKYQRDKINFCSTDSVQPLGFKKVVSLYLLLAGASLFAAAALGVEWLFRLTAQTKPQPNVSQLANVIRGGKPSIINDIKPISSDSKPNQYPAPSNNSLAYKTYYYS